MEREIKLSLEKAQEWYKQGGDLRAVALQAFTEYELNPKPLVPDSWEEAVKGKESHYVRSVSGIGTLGKKSNYSLKDRNAVPTEEMAKALLALTQLSMLRAETWRRCDNWEPDYTDGTPNCCAYFNGRKLTSESLYSTQCFLTFPTEEVLNEFIEKHEELIYKAKPWL